MNLHKECPICIDENNVVDTNTHVVINEKDSNKTKTPKSPLAFDTNFDPTLETGNWEEPVPFDPNCKSEEILNQLNNNATLDINEHLIDKIYKVLMFFKNIDANPGSFPFEKHGEIISIIEAYGKSDYKSIRENINSFNDHYYHNLSEDLNVLLHDLYGDVLFKNALKAAKEPEKEEENTITASSSSNTNQQTNSNINTPSDTSKKLTENNSENETNMKPKNLNTQAHIENQSDKNNNNDKEIIHDENYQQALSNFTAQVSEENKLLYNTSLYESILNLYSSKKNN